MKGPVSLNLRAKEDASSWYVVASASNICLNSSCNYVETTLKSKIYSLRVVAWIFIIARSTISDIGFLSFSRFPPCRAENWYIPNYPESPGHAVKQHEHWKGIGRHDVPLLPAPRWRVAIDAIRFFFSLYRELSSSFSPRTSGISYLLLEQSNFAHGKQV